MWLYLFNCRSCRAGLVAGHSPRGHGFDSRAVRVRFVVNRMVVDTGFSLCISVFPCQHQSTSAAYSHFIHSYITDAVVASLKTSDDALGESQPNISQF